VSAAPERSFTAEVAEWTGEDTEVLRAPEARTHADEGLRHADAWRDLSASSPVRSATSAVNPCHVIGKAKGAIP